MPYIRVRGTGRAFQRDRPWFLMGGMIARRRATSHRAVDPCINEAAGCLVIELEAGDFVETRRIALMK